ncbi:MAG: UbiX family flavin prenyltransferase [Betaproteobacteria bacterium]|nr:UbiX family flavin prenyltransferase [Betaproteobacteria bacterium]MBU6511903.1 UbiX family flavin prenyltransferase [Betaproteobacteria bacterium]MDE1956547.1 UbiX family flavin prenyltransferase [Betaproteobacteria bacterium]MDE2152264.1 UbiX family flavin prenyltransferase [Betaproteobacteria bacterium]MDE2479580.1 UbiX family flavin prenyltransferase [Betaproteobacteria bacterium]
MQSPPPRLIVGITGATGAVYGVRLLQHLRRLGGVRSHLVVSPAGWMSLRAETDLERRDVEALADEVHPIGDVAASIASGSFATLGMVVAPCSMKTLAAVAHGLSDNLLSRAADVCLKERRRLVLLARETPLNLAHLRNMTLVTEMGGVVMPPLPALYLRPRSLEEMVDHTLGRVLEQFGLAHDLAPAWTGWPAPEGAART